MNNRTLYFLASLVLSYASIMWYVEMGERKYFIVVFLVFSITVFTGLNLYYHLRPNKNDLTTLEYDELAALMEQEGDFQYDATGFSIQKTKRIAWDDVEKISIYKYVRVHEPHFIKIRLEVNDRTVDILDNVSGFPKFYSTMMDYLGVTYFGEWKEHLKDEVVVVYEKIQETELENTKKD